MSEVNGKVRSFFDRYEKANAGFEVQGLAGLYADVFMFAHPEGIRSVKKEDFVKLLPQRKEFFKSLGLQSSTIVSIQTFELDAQYVLAKVVWKFRLERKSRELIDSENSSTYIMMAVDDSFQIVFQLDHDNLAKKLEEFSN